MRTVRVKVLPHQLHLVETDKRATALVGGRGSAKTRGGAILAHRWLKDFPGLPFGVVADDYPKLRTNFIAELLDYFAEVGWIEGQHYRYNKNEKKFTAYTGASLIGFTMEKPPERTKGPTLAGIIWDESESITEQHFDIFSICARHPRGPRRNVVLANPVPPAHWINKRFVGSNSDDDTELLRVSSYDNPFLTEDQIRFLEKLYPPGTDLHRRWVLGESVALEGAVYPMFDPDVHVVSADDVPELLGHVAGLDLGVRDPSVLLSIGVDRDGGIWIDGEYTSTSGMSPQDQSVPMRHLLTRQGIPHGPGSTKIFSDHSLTFCTALEHEGIYTVNAAKDVQTGIAAVQARLTNGYLHLVKDACPGLEEAMQLYRWSDSKEQEVPEHKHSHHPDSLRYGVMGLDHSDRLRFKWNS